MDAGESVYADTYHVEQSGDEFVKGDVWYLIPEAIIDPDAEARRYRSETIAEGIAASVLAPTYTERLRDSVTDEINGEDVDPTPD